MSADLFSVFLPKFIAIASTRITRSIELATQRSPEHLPAIARELHSIVGEAGLLGIDSVVVLARAAEEQLSRLRKGQPDGNADALVATLGELRVAIEAVGPRPEANT